MTKKTHGPANLRDILRAVEGIALSLQGHSGQPRELHLAIDAALREATQANLVGLITSQEQTQDQSGDIKPRALATAETP